MSFQAGTELRVGWDDPVIGVIQWDRWDIYDMIKEKYDDGTPKTYDNSKDNLLRIMKIIGFIIEFSTFGLQN